MKKYELTYIITPEITSEEAEGKAKEIEAFIQAKEGVIISQSFKGAKVLAYPIGKKASGYIGVIEFDSEPEKVPEINDILTKDSGVLRQMIALKQINKTVEPRKRMPPPQPETSKEEKIEASEEKSDSSKIDLQDFDKKLDELLGQ